LSGLLLDTNVVSELRKAHRANASVLAWYAGVSEQTLWLSVLVLGEIRRGIETLRRRDRKAALALDRWVARVEHEHHGRILAVDLAVAQEWGRLDAALALAPIDGLLAATARVHDLTLVTRNTRDVARTGVRCLNPFEGKR
jgi:predicted nucleic acid-binding protein